MDAAPSPTPPPAVARKERRRARTRARILDAAEEVFHRDGFHAARVEQIADTADLSVGSLYGYYAGKRGLFLALVERSLDLFSDYMAAVDDPGYSPLQRVLAGGDAYLRFHSEHPGLFSFLSYGTGPNGDGPPVDAASTDRIRVRVGDLLDRFAGHIQAAIDSGQAAPVDPHRLTRFLWGAWNGVIALQTQPTGLRPDEDEIAEILEVGRWLLRQGLASPALRGPDGLVTDDQVPMPFWEGSRSRLG